jgi:hypothetical protein
MAKRLSDSERTEQYFTALAHENKAAALIAYDRVTLILKTLGVIVPVKRTRKPKEPKQPKAEPLR